MKKVIALSEYAGRLALCSWRDLRRPDAQCGRMGKAVLGQDLCGMCREDAGVSGPAIRFCAGQGGEQRFCLGHIASRAREALLRDHPEAVDIARHCGGRSVSQFRRAVRRSRHSAEVSELHPAVPGHQDIRLLYRTMPQAGLVSDMQRLCSLCHHVEDGR